MNAELFLFYVFCASGVFAYGIGLKQTTIRSKTMRFYLSYSIKTLVCTFLCIAPVYAFTSWLLVPAGLVEIFPLFLVLIMLVVVRVYDGVLLLAKLQPPSGILLPLPLVFIAINESFTMKEAYCIALAILLAVFFLIPLFYCIRKRLSLAFYPQNFKLPITIFFTTAILFFALYAWHISWFNQEILK